ncbi:hypothetical protein INT44_006028, partial [Umbelopsis vinacea]
MAQTSKRPRITAEGLQLSFEVSWKRKLDDPIICLTVGKPFLEELNEENDILIGTSSGKILILNEEKEDTVLDTKSGSIQSIVLYDVTGFNAMDLIVGDSDGTVTVFSRRQMLSKRIIGAAITHLEMYEDAIGGFEIISGGVDGIVTSFHPHDSRWRCNVGEESARLYTGSATAGHSPSIRCLLSVKLEDTDGLSISYTLVCDGWPLLHFLSKGERIMTISLPAIINTVSFIYSRHENLKISSFFSVGYPVTKLLRYRPRGLKNTSPDVLICAGHRNELKAYHNGMHITTYETEDWVHDMTLGDIDADDNEEL